VRNGDQKNNGLKKVERNITYQFLQRNNNNICLLVIRLDCLCNETLIVWQRYAPCVHPFSKAHEHAARPSQSSVAPLFTLYIYNCVPVRLMINKENP
jgi:hypothetical protein